MQGRTKNLQSRNSNPEKGDSRITKFIRRIKPEAATPDPELVQLISEVRTETVGAAIELNALKQRIVGSPIEFDIFGPELRRSIHE